MLTRCLLGTLGDGQLGRMDGKQKGSYVLLLGLTDGCIGGPCAPNIQSGDSHLLL